MQEAGIELLPNGGILVDDHLRTTKPGVYAAGDVTGRDQFVYMAAYGAKLAALNAMNGDNLTYDNTAMPWVVFTDPQIAGVGLSEAAVMAIKHGMTTKALGETIFLYLTTVEGLKLAAQSFGKDVIKLSCCAG